MNLWLLLGLDFIVQEPITSSALLLTAYQLHYNVWAIHALFLAATTFDACVGYWIGQTFKEKFATGKLSVWLNKRAKQFERFAGKHGKRAALLFWGPTIFPYSAVLAPLLGYTFAENLILSVIGDTVLWYGSVWLLVLGIKTAIDSPLWTLFVVAGVLLFFVLVLRYFTLQRVKEDRSSES